MLADLRSVDEGRTGSTSEAACGWAIFDRPAQRQEMLKRGGRIRLPGSCAAGGQRSQLGAEIRHDLANRGDRPRYVMFLLQQTMHRFLRVLGAPLSEAIGQI